MAERVEVIDVLTAALYVLTGLPNHVRYVDPFVASALALSRTTTFRNTGAITGPCWSDGSLPPARDPLGPKDGTAVGARL